MTRAEFREACMERDHKMCVVPSCARLADDIVSTEPDAPGDVHHIIEYTHPDFITSNNMCTCMDFANQCGWAATSVKYYTYTGPNIQNIK